MCNENYETIKELLVLEFDRVRSRNMELFKLGLEMGSLQTRSVYAIELSNGRVRVRGTYLGWNLHVLISKSWLMVVPAL